jgi:hypothetical protein
MIDTLDTIVAAVDTVTATVVDPIDPIILDPMTPWYVEHYVELIFIVLAAVKAVLNLVPSEKPRQIFGYLDTFIGLIFKDRRK